MSSLCQMLIKSSWLNSDLELAHWHNILCYNIEDYLSPWDFITLCYIYSWWKHLDESFLMQSKANIHNHQFLRYKCFSVWWLLISWSLSKYLWCWGVPSIIRKVFLRAFQYNLDGWNRPIIHGDTSEWSLWHHPFPLTLFYYSFPFSFFFYL